MKTRVSYPGFDKFSDEGGSASKGNLISFIESDDMTYSQADWFAPNTASVSQSVNRGFRLLHLGHIGKRSKQRSWPRQPSERSSKQVPGADEDSMRRPDLAKGM